MSEKYQLRNNITAVDLLQIAFIILKLCGVIKWSWIWVLAPIWITAIIAVIAAFIVTHLKGGIK